MARPLALDLDLDAAFEALRAPGSPAVLLDGRGGAEGAWTSLLALEPRYAPCSTSALDARVEARRAAGGPGGTGIVLIAPYELTVDRLPVFEVDTSIAFPEGAAPLERGDRDALARARSKLEAAVSRAAPHASPPAAPGRPRTTLPREAYRRAVDRVRDHIARGDIYQANLTQTFTAPFEDDPWRLYRRLTAATPAPRSAYVAAEGWALASVTPEVFVDIDRTGRAHTRPIKGTRPRGATPEADAAAAAELLASEKDRAELVMIVDVERNDLGRLARTGSVVVPELLGLRSYPAVHHLVARVEADLPAGLAPSALLAAVFPGGSITGAPKERAIEILRVLEPGPRGFYTGSLFWFDDDGDTQSSILIRSAVISHGKVSIGAGGGIVSDSDPEAEWMEANAKARALTRAVGFEPEEAV